MNLSEAKEYLNDNGYELLDEADHHYVNAIVQLYDAYYDLMYQNIIPEKRSLMKKFDNHQLTDEENEALSAFVKYRQDYFTSDREVIAFMMVLKLVGAEAIIKAFGG